MLRSLPLRFIQQNQFVWSLLPTTQIYGLEWGGIWNWVRNAHWAATTESLGMNASTAIARAFDHAFSATGGGAEWGQLGKNFPLHFFEYTIATALSFNSFSLHTYENREVVLLHPVLFNCEWLYWFVTEQFSYFEKIVARYTHLLLFAQGYWSMETDRIR